MKRLGAVILDKNQGITDNQFSINSIFLKKEFYVIHSEDISTVRDYLSNPKLPNPDCRKSNADFNIEQKELESIPNEENDANYRITKLVKLIFFFFLIF
jgi:hypothetical protein